MFLWPPLFLSPPHGTQTRLTQHNELKQNNEEISITNVRKIVLNKSICISLQKSKVLTSIAIAVEIFKLRYCKFIEFYFYVEGQMEASHLGIWSTVRFWSSYFADQSRKIMLHVVGRLCYSVSCLFGQWREVSI